MGIVQRCVVLVSTVPGDDMRIAQALMPAVQVVATNGQSRRDRMTLDPFLGDFLRPLALPVVAD